MKRLKKKICIALSALVCLSAGVWGGSLLYSDKQVVEAEEGYTKNSFAILETASVREDTSRHGIRFTTVIGEEKRASWGDKYTLGTLIIPKDIYEASGQELTLGFKYTSGSEVYYPSVSEFCGDVNTLQEDKENTDCKLFNAVLELTAITTTNPEFVRRELVARTFVTVNGITSYAEGISVRSASHVAAVALDNNAVNNERVINFYVRDLQGVAFKDEQVNVHVGDAITATVDPAGMCPVNYTVTGNAEVKDSVATATAEGAGTVSASVAGGRQTAQTQFLSLDDKKLERKYYSETDTLTFKAYNVDGVEYNGKTLDGAREYTQNNTEISIEKNVLCGTTQEENELTFKSATSGDVTVKITVRYDVDNTALLPKNLDYSNSGKEFEHFAYHSVRKSDLVVDDDGTPGGTLTTSTATDAQGNPIDFFEESYIADYYDSGMKYLLGQSSAGISGLSAHPTLESATNLHKTMETAHSLGYDNSVIVTDGAITDMVRLVMKTNYPNIAHEESELTSSEILANKGYLKDTWETNAPTFISDNGTFSSLSSSGNWQFKTEAKLDELIETLLSRYMNHEAFGGILLYDEPHVQYLRVVAQLYKSIQRVFAKHGLTDKKIIVNLLPFYPGNSDHFAFESTSGDQQLYEAYKNYLDLYLAETGAKDLQMDIYSLYETGIYRYHMVNMQMAAEVAKKYGAKIVDLTSSWQRLGDGGERLHSYKDMNFMNNMAMAYGSSNVAYYTYHALNDTDSQVVSNDGSMINRQGEKTDRYYYVKELNAKAQVLAPTILNFDYVQGNVYTNIQSSNLTELKNGSYHDKISAYNGTVKTFANLRSVTQKDSKYGWLVNELYDDERDNYMYAVMNICDTLNVTTGTTKSITLEFPSSYQYVWAFFDGNFQALPLTNGQITLNVAEGECYYLIPYKQYHDTDFVVPPSSNWGSNWDGK